MSLLKLFSWGGCLLQGIDGVVVVELRLLLDEVPPVADRVGHQEVDHVLRLRQVLDRDALEGPL